MTRLLPIDDCLDCNLFNLQHEECTKTNRKPMSAFNKNICMVHFPIPDWCPLEKKDDKGN